MLLVNKADLVSEEQRKEWAKYFNERKIDFIFFSAVEEQERLEDEAEKEEESEPEEEKGLDFFLCSANQRFPFTSPNKSTNHRL